MRDHLRFRTEEQEWLVRICSDLTVLHFTFSFQCSHGARSSAEGILAISQRELSQSYAYKLVSAKVAWLPQGS